MTGEAPWGPAAVDAAAVAIRQRCGAPPEAAVVLGSGMGALAARVESPALIPYADVPGWPAPSVAGHEGRLVVGSLAGRRVAVLAGRTHLYEGRGVDAVTFAVRVMGRLGVRRIVLTNAAGGVNPALEPGTLMIVDDHINLQGVTPLTGPRFLDMTEAYSPRLRAAADAAAREAGIAVAHGVYAAVPGPSYETPAEVRALRTIGADAVGMSTVPEAIAARALDMEVAAVSCITNLAAGVGSAPLSHADVLEAAARAENDLAILLTGLIARLQGT